MSIKMAPVIRRRPCDVDRQPVARARRARAAALDGYTFRAGRHGCGYYPEEPRLGVLYELLDMQRVDRITVKGRVHTDVAKIASIVDLWPGVDVPHREVYDMFGVVFDGHRIWAGS